ncbi:hypothetical protein ACROYT_G023921 [Oculina patagonica]
MGQTESTPCASPEPTPEPPEEGGLENKAADTGAEKQESEGQQVASQTIAQAQPSADAITRDSKVTEQKLNDSRSLKSDENLNKLERKSRALINAATKQKLNDSRNLKSDENLNKLEGTSRALINAATDQKLNDSRSLKSDENLNKLEGKSRALINAAKVVQQVANVKMFISSFKKDSEYVFVEIPKRPDDYAADLGFTLHGGIENPRIPGDPGIFINHVIPGSLVDRKLRSGDRVLSINGINVTKVPLKYARQAVRKAKGVVRLYIKKAPRRQQRINEAIKKENELEVPVFSNEQIEEFEGAFSVFDVRGSGLIRVSAVFPLIRSLGHNPLEAKVWVFMNELDLTANRKLKFEEFLRLMAALIMDEDNNEEHALDSIRVFDCEERGYISSEELETALKRMPGKAQMTEFELRDILRKADPDKDGKINIQDFQSLLEPSVRLK